MTEEEKRALAYIRMLNDQRGYTPSGPDSQFFPDGPPAPPSNPYLPLAMFPETNKDGTPNVNDQLTAFNKWDSSVNDPYVAGLAGGEGFSPDAFTANEEWEPIKTPLRDDLRRYSQAAQRTGVPTWQSIMADALLDGYTDEEARKAAQNAVEAQLVAAPSEMKEDQMKGVVPVDPYISMSNFANRYFTGLASEANVDSPNIRENPDTGIIEMRKSDGKTDTMKKFDELGLPYPNQEYSMDWLAGTDQGAQMLGEIGQRRQGAEAALEAQRSPYDQFGQLVGQPPEQGGFMGFNKSVAKQPDRQGLMGMMKSLVGGDGGSVADSIPGELGDSIRAAMSRTAGGGYPQGASPFAALENPTQPAAQSPLVDQLKGPSGAAPALPSVGPQEQMLNIARLSANAQGETGQAMDVARMKADQAEKQGYIEAGTPNRLTAAERRALEEKRKQPRPGANPAKARVRNGETTAAMIRNLTSTGAAYADKDRLRLDMALAAAAGRTPYRDATEARSRAMMQYGGFLG